MKTQFICLALVIVLICPLAFAQSVQTSGIGNPQGSHLSVKGANLFQETPRELLGPSNQHRIQTDFTLRVDSLRAKRLQLPFFEESLIQNGIQRSYRSLRRISAQQSQIFVIDTAVLRSTEDTTRHVYSFNANALRTSDVTQKLIAGLWVDTLRDTDTYDASNNMLSDLNEQWSNGQWVNI